MPSITYTLPETTNFEANTGPKGVIADARSFESAKKRSFRQTLHAFSNGSFGKTNKAGAYDFSREKSPSPDMSDDDDEFMRLWRQNRLDELSSMKSEVMTKRRSPSKRKYGGLTAVDAVGYLDAIEKVSAETVVVVLIYDHEVRFSSLLKLAFYQIWDQKANWETQNPDSSKVEDALDRIAHKHVTTRFVKLHQLEAEMDEIAVPGILAYQGGECFANLVSIMNAMPAGKEMNQTNLDAVLQE